MDDSTVMVIIVDGLRLMLLLGTPLLLSALVAGLLVAVFQAATQINEVTLSFVPKMLAIAAVLALMGPWMIGLLVNYTRDLLISLPGMIG